MSDTVNSQITDAVTQVNVKVLGDAPPIAMGGLYQTVGNSVKQVLAEGAYHHDVALQIHRIANEMGISLLYNGEIPKGGLKDQDVIDHLHGIIRDHQG